MFKDVPNLNQIEIITNRTCKITSIISTFENCESLENIIITGIDLTELKSVKKLFYKINFNDNMEKFLKIRQILKICHICSHLHQSKNLI